MVCGAVNMSAPPVILRSFHLAYIILTSSLLSQHLISSSPLSAFLPSIYLPTSPSPYTNTTKMCVYVCVCVSQDSVTAWVVWLFLLWINEHKEWRPTLALGNRVCMDWTPLLGISNIYPVNTWIRLGFCESISISICVCHVTYVLWGRSDNPCSNVTEDVGGWSL